MHRMARIVDWPGRIAFGLGAGTLLTLLLEFSGPHSHAGTRDYDAIRAGALAAVIGGGVMLFLSWGQRRWREYGRSREKRRAIRLATLLAHADPVTAQVAEQGQEIAEVKAATVAVERKVDTLLATFADVLEGQGDASASLQQTMPMLRLIQGGAEEEQQDSA